MRSNRFQLNIFKLSVWQADADVQRFDGVIVHTDVNGIFRQRERPQRMTEGGCGRGRHNRCSIVQHTSNNDVITYLVTHLTWIYYHLTQIQRGCHLPQTYSHSTQIQRVSLASYIQSLNSNKERVLLTLDIQSFNSYREGVTYLRQSINSDKERVSLTSDIERHIQRYRQSEELEACLLHIKRPQNKWKTVCAHVKCTQYKVSPSHHH